MSNHTPHSRSDTVQVSIFSLSELGRVIKKRRKELGVTQKELAMLCNLSHNGISKIELGISDVKLSTLLRLGTFLGFEIQLHMEN